MGLLERMRAVQDRRRSWPVGPAVVEPFEKAHGHDDELFSPENYGDYIVTSNEVFAAASLRAKLASSVPLRVYRGRDEDKRELPDSAAAKLLRFVNPFWTQARLARMDSLCMDVWGETVWAVEKFRGEPQEIWWLKPSRVKPVPNENNYLAGFLYESNVVGTDGTRQVISFRPDEIVWQRYPNPLDEFSALSPIAAARLAADTASAMMKANRNLHSQGLQIAGMVVPPANVQFTSEQARELEERLQKRFAGADKAHRWAVMRYEAQFKPVNITPKDAEFINGLGLTLRQVANAFGVPAPLLNDLEHATLANLREFQKALWEHSLVPDLTLRAQELEEQFLPMFGRRGRSTPDHVAFDFSRIAALQESQSEAWDRERQAIEVGALTVNEWRKKHGMPPVDWGDVWWAPVNKAAVTSAGSQPQGDTSPTALPTGGPPPPTNGDDEARALLSALDLPFWSLR
ncbi:hypothetical protein GCM10012275_38360 [Longimycelium tulufanense]|uniref:Phage portal protein n=1 Tax=Longimycelium tulufanense TaxID=907463 RepID=A0A8J3FWZ8_9PSEU|nr:phage portal protein [Longimycelium tulufanense]GGM64139.1 hypothetical protein GCM10012275_38360 [Longimycelium tulufanense]